MRVGQEIGGWVIRDRIRIKGPKSVDVIHVFINLDTEEGTVFRSQDSNSLVIAHWVGR